MTGPKRLRLGFVRESVKTEGVICDDACAITIATSLSWKKPY